MSNFMSEQPQPANNKSNVEIPRKKTMSEAAIAANRANAQVSTGAPPRASSNPHRTPCITASTAAATSNISSTTMTSPSRSSQTSWSILNKPVHHLNQILRKLNSLHSRIQSTIKAPRAEQARREQLATTTTENLEIEPKPSSLPGGLLFKLFAERILSMYSVEPEPPPSETPQIQEQT